jgi:hypothetical protein
VSPTPPHHTTPRYCSLCRTTIAYCSTVNSTVASMGWRDRYAKHAKAVVHTISLFTSKSGKGAYFAANILLVYSHRPLLVPIQSTCFPFVFPNSSWSCYHSNGRLRSVWNISHGVFCPFAGFQCCAPQIERCFLLNHSHPIGSCSGLFSVFFLNWLSWTAPLAIHSLSSFT